MQFPEATLCSVSPSANKEVYRPLCKAAWDGKGWFVKLHCQGNQQVIDSPRHMLSKENQLPLGSEASIMWRSLFPDTAWHGGYFMDSLPIWKTLLFRYEKLRSNEEETHSRSHRKLRNRTAEAELSTNLHLPLTCCVKISHPPWLWIYPFLLVILLDFALYLVKPYYTDSNNL